jgi:uncharacterized OB-fold protein
MSLSPVKVWRSQKHVARLIGKVGVIVSFTMVRVPPVGFASQAPYPVAIIKFNDGNHMTVQLVDWEPSHLVIGQKVMTIIRRVAESTGEDVIPYGIKAKPIDTP